MEGLLGLGRAKCNVEVLSGLRAAKKITKKLCLDCEYPGKGGCDEQGAISAHVHMEYP